jgi:hypothetical protein
MKNQHIIQQLFLAEFGGLVGKLFPGRKSDWQIYLDGLKYTYSRWPVLQAE